MGAFGPIVLLGCSLSIISIANAQTPGVEPGAIQREFEKPEPVQSGGQLVLPAPLLPSAPLGAADTRLVLKAVSVEGASVFSQAELEANAAPLIGKDVALSQVFEVAQAITKAYSDAGYPLSVAFVPAQEIKDGTVKIQVVEGYVSELEIAGDAGPSASLLKVHGEKLMAVKPLTRGALERYLLLANDIPGLSVRAVFDRGTAGTGGVKLILAATRKPVDMSIGINNRGSKALGPERGVVSLIENGNLTGRESIELDVVQSFQTEELSYVFGRAQTLLDAEGTALALTGAWSTSEPGTAALKALGFQSDGWTAAAELSHPLVRSRELNIRLAASFEAQELNSDFGVVPNSRDSLRVLRGSLHTDFLDWLGGITQAGVTVSQGLDIFDATTETDPFKSRAFGSGDFTSALLSLSHLQPLAEGLDLSLSVSGQLASRQLLASEECGYGGAVHGRGFDNYEIAGEDCVSGLAELRYLLPVGGDDFSLQPYGFYDAGLVRQEGTLLPGELRQQTGQSVGGGLRASLGRHINASVEFAQPLTRDVALEGNRDGRVFFSVVLSR